MQRMLLTVAATLLMTAPSWATPVRDVPGLTDVRIWEKTTNVFTFNYVPEHTALLTRRTDITSSGDFKGANSEYYDAFYSDADGTLNADGQYLTIEGVFLHAGGFNITGAALVFGGDLEFADRISAYTYGDNPTLGSEAAAIDGNINTNTTFGTAGNANRMSITLGFASSVPEPTSAVLLASAASTLLPRRRR